MPFNFISLKISSSDLQSVLFNAFLVMLSHFSIIIAKASNSLESIPPFNYILSLFVKHKEFKKYLMLFFFKKEIYS